MSQGKCSNHSQGTFKFLEQEINPANPDQFNVIHTQKIKILSLNTNHSIIYSMFEVGAFHS